ncbi:MAG: protein phosphatase 2C domain-containing protein [Acidobacteriota bacterium]|nr:protein phosphatase 2C domain-containing protein [Acidobacteriota bacterium]
MEKKPIEVPTLTNEEIASFVPPSLIYPGLSELFGHYSRLHLKQIISQRNSYTWFRFVESESKALIFKKMATRILYRMLKRKSLQEICSGNENGCLFGDRAVGLTSRGVNYKMVNEDGIGIFEEDEQLTMVVCDGVGDCLVGEVASYVILNEFLNGPDKSLAQIFSDSVEVLTRLGRDMVDEIPEFHTFPNDISQAAVTAVRVKGDQCEIAQVGDVLLFHIRDGKLRLLDQNRKWLNMEQLSKLFADEHYLAQRHIIANAVGKNYDPYWVSTYLTLEPGDLLILASDGLETLHPQDIEELAGREKETKVLLSRLYKRSIEANLKWNTLGSPIYTKPDNISIIIYRYDGDGNN